MQRFMNNTFVLFCTASLFFFTACTSEQKEENGQRKPQKEALNKVDTTYAIEQATKSDIVFDDFLLAYTSDSAFQWKRTHFPLHHRDKEGKEAFIAEDEWKMATLFHGEELYTIISNNEAEMDLSTDTSLKEGRFEWIYLQENKISSYLFQRNGQHAWYLERFDESHLTDNPNGQFLKFYKKFATDPEYQKQHVRKTIDFVTNFTDETEGFNTEHFRVDAEQWLAWQVPMPSQKLTNIVYGHQDTAQIAASHIKIMTIRSMDGTFFKALYFRKNRIGDWYLYRYEDTAY
jgi:hypothetical protein